MNVKGTIKECGRLHDSASRGTQGGVKPPHSKAGGARKAFKLQWSGSRLGLPSYWSSWSSVAGNMALGWETGRLRSGLSVCGSGRSGSAGVSLPVRPKA